MSHAGPGWVLRALAQRFRPWGRGVPALRRVDQAGAVWWALEPLLPPVPAQAVNLLPDAFAGMRCSTVAPVIAVSRTDCLVVRPWKGQTGGTGPAALPGLRLSKVIILECVDLRPGSAGRTELRVLFAFDPRRHSIKLIAGDKAGTWRSGTGRTSR